MNQLGTFPLISIITFLPLAGAIIISFIPARLEILQKQIAFIFSGLSFIASLPLFFFFNFNTPLLQFVEKSEWIPQLGISYYVGIDGLSLLLVLLTTFLSVLAILASYNDIKIHTRGYYASMLLLETGMIGVFVSADMILFYIFWEAMLIPMYFIIGIWGGPKRVYAAVKFFLYTLFGSLLMLAAILILYKLNVEQTGEATFEISKFYNLKIDASMQVWLFLAFALAFAIKVPMFPFHTWLPDAHVEAPTAGSVLLAGILLKMGTYGFIRFCLPIFPEASKNFAFPIIVLAIIGVIYGALMSLVQEDVKKLVAYSSVSHLGMVMLGIFVFNIQGLQGAIIQMINHGLSTGALFLIVGMLYERRHTRRIEDYGGLAKVMPNFYAYFLIVMLSSIGLPLLNGFIGEFLILLGAFKDNTIYSVLAATGVILSAYYMLRMFKKVMFGPLDKKENKNLPDLSNREKAILIAVVAIIIWIGIFPNIFLKSMTASVNQLLSKFL